MKSSTLLQWLICLAVFLNFLLCGVESRASLESELLCSPLSIEPHQKSSCIINARNSQQEPTMAFDVEDFTVTAYSSVPEAALNVTPLRRGDDVTTAVFDISAAEATTITVNVMYSLGLQSSQIRNSGLVVAVMTWPAVRMGPISCDVPSAGLVLRSTTTCRAALFDSNNRRAVVHETDVAFVEEKNLGSFKFLSGKGDLVFNFTAASFPSIAGSSFALYLTLIGDSNVYSVRFPLLYPDLPPDASFSTLLCSNETVPITCMLRALDAMGPVKLDLDSFRMDVDMLDGNHMQGKWVDNTNAFDVSVRTLSQADTAIISWKLKVNNIIKPQRLHVYVVFSTTGSTAVGGSNEKRLKEVWGSPFPFVSGVMPRAAYVSLRGCQVSSITSGNRTQCFADLNNGVTGDLRYFNLASARNAALEDIAYLPNDPVSKTPGISFVYVAPIIKTPSEDFITLLVDGQNAMHSPFQMHLFPPRTPTADMDLEPLRGSNALVIGIGLVFFGFIIGTGSYLALQRTLRLNRIRSLRALQKMHEMEEKEEAMRTTSVQLDVGDVQQQRQRERESDSE